MKRFASLFLILGAASLFAASPVTHLSEKQLAAASIEKNRDQLIALSDEVWRYAETALKETKSSKALADFAEQKGFRVTRGVAGMPTASSGLTSLSLSSALGGEGCRHPRRAGGTLPRPTTRSSPQFWSPACD